MLALNLYTSPSNNGGIVLYLDVDLGHMEVFCHFNWHKQIVHVITNRAEIFYVIHF